ncbi:MAG: DUF378 domain-containing protein [Nanoarchaeota archaeon]|nr:DUF378 domain-containing protein [Nanoarchaeota archaeon]
MLKKIFRRIYIIAELLVIFGAINWGVVGIFRFDVMTWIFGPMTPAARVIYTAMGISALWVVYSMIRNRSVSNPAETPTPRHHLSKRR